MINIVFSELDVTYKGDTGGGTIYDMIALPGGGVGGFGPFNPALADVIRTAVFSVDTTTLGTLVHEPTNEMYGDLKVSGVGPSLTLNSLYTTGSNGGGFGFDWFTTDGNTTGNFLQIGIDEIDLTLNKIGAVNIAFSFSGVATLRGQNLPFGLAFDPNEPIIFTYTAPFPITDAGANPTSAMGRGALVITGTMFTPEVPEPASVILVGAGLAVAALIILRRRRLCPQTVPVRRDRRAEPPARE